MPCGWEGNRWSGLALAMRHRLKWFIHLRAHGPDREMSTPPTLSCGVWSNAIEDTAGQVHFRSFIYGRSSTNQWRNDGVAAASSDGGPTGGREPPTVLEFLVINFRP